jgi:hypothetical protein
VNGFDDPPAVPTALVAALISDPRLREAVIGDLAEDYRLAAATSKRAATLWYWSQLVRSAIPLAFLSYIGTGWRGWMRLGWAILAGYASLATLVILSDLILGWLLPHAAGDLAMPVASLAIGVLCAIAGGYVAAWAGGRAPIAAALALGLAATLLSAASLVWGGDGTPVWYQIGLMVIVLPSVTAGACVRAWLLTRRNKDGD